MLCKLIDWLSYDRAIGVLKNCLFTQYYYTLSSQYEEINSFSPSLKNGKILGPKFFMSFYDSSKKW